MVTMNSNDSKCYNKSVVKCKGLSASQWNKLKQEDGKYIEEYANGPDWEEWERKKKEGQRPPGQRRDFITFRGESSLR